MKDYELSVVFHPDLEMNLDPALDKVKRSSSQIRVKSSKRRTTVKNVSPIRLTAKNLASTTILTSSFQPKPHPKSVAPLTLLMRFCAIFSSKLTLKGRQPNQWKSQNQNQPLIKKENNLLCADFLKLLLPVI